MPASEDQLCVCRAEAAHLWQVGLPCTTFVINLPKQTAITQAVGPSPGQPPLTQAVAAQVSKCLVTLPDVFDVAVGSLLDELIAGGAALPGQLRQSSPVQDTCGERVAVLWCLFSANQLDAAVMSSV